jgi:hypothetical protein
MVSRGGRVRARVIDSRSLRDIRSQMAQHVLRDSMIFTDEYGVYEGSDREFRGHRRVKHEARVYVDGDAHTQTVEGFFGLFKMGVRGVYLAISTAYLQDYLNEYTFRYNRRRSLQPMFWAMLNRVRKDRPPALASP